MKSFQFFVKKLACMLLFCSLSTPAWLPAQNHFDYPFNGNEVRVTEYNAFERYVTIRIPFYDHDGLDRWYRTNGLNDVADQAIKKYGAVLEYLVEDNENTPKNWQYLLVIDGRNSSQYEGDKWNDFWVKVVDSKYRVEAVDNLGHAAFVGPKFPDLTPELLSNQDQQVCYEYNRFSTLSHHEHKYFASFKWYFGDNLDELNNKVISFRLRGSVYLNQSNNYQPFVWYARAENMNPAKFVIGNPLHAPGVPTPATGIPNFPYLPNGHLKVDVPLYQFDNVCDKGTVSWGMALSPRYGLSFAEKEQYGAAQTFSFESNEAMPKFYMGFRYDIYAVTWRTDYSEVNYGTNSDFWAEYPIMSFKAGGNYYVEPYPQPQSLSVSVSGLKLTLSWHMQLGTSASRNDPYEFQWAEGSPTTWHTVTENGVPLIKSYDYSETNPSQEISFPQGFNQGPKTYFFRVRRAGIDWEARDNTGLLYCAQAVKSISTSFPIFEYISANAVADNHIEVNWIISTGVSDPNTFSLRITKFVNNVAGTPQNLPWNIRTFLDTEYESCQPTYYKMEILNSGTPVAERFTSPVVMPPSYLGKVTDLSVSKGFYNNRVVVKWQATQGAGFTRYTVHRQPLGVPNAAAMQIADIAASGVVQYTYEDVNAIPGEYYTYIVKAWIECQGVQHMVSEDHSTGFMQPYGVVSGRVVTQMGRMPVKDCTITAAPQDSLFSAFRNRALACTDSVAVLIDSDLPMLSGEEVTVQAWVKLQNSNNATALLHNKNYVVSISYAGVAIGVRDPFSPSPAYTRLASIDANIPPNQYTHITVTIKCNANPDLDIYKLYIDGILVGTQQGALAGTSAAIWAVLMNLMFDANADGTTIGCARPNSLLSVDPYAYFFSGFIDEFRIWNRVLDTTEVFGNFNRCLAGNESGLIGYYRFDELNWLSEVFDISGRNQIFNENHGTIITKYGGAVEYRSETEIPSRDQLGIKGTTNDNGAYFINTIPYSGEGGDFWVIRAIMGTHTFVENDIPVYFSPQSTVHNNINFEDDSFFKVEGKVFYQGGDYPVSECTFEIDGQIVLKDGRPVQSDEIGKFIIYVPIGRHKVQIKKPGHTFLDDGYLIDNKGEDINYEHDINDVVFQDVTRIKLIGHIVGGVIEHEKKSGHGLRNNNIGATTLTLTAQNGSYFLNDSDNDIDTVFYHHEDAYGKWKLHTKDHAIIYPPATTGGVYEGGVNPARTNLKGQPLSKDSTLMTIQNRSREIKITVSPQTGEFVAWVYPEAYRIGDIKDGFGNTFYKANELLDLRKSTVMNENLMKMSIFSYPDSVFHTDPGAGYQADYWEYFDNADTIRFHYEKGFYYQPEPTFSIKQVVNAQEVDYFGDATFKMIMLDNIEMIDLVLPGGGYLLGDPVFTQGTRYRYNLSAYEEYENPLCTVGDSHYSTRVPLENCWVFFTGNLMDDNSPAGVQLDENGEGYFSFLGGLPNTSDGIRYFRPVVRVGGIPFYSQQFSQLDAWLLGATTTGTNFVTAATDKIDYILHDPPGSNSYAYIEKGTSKAFRRVTNIQEEGSFIRNTNLIWGYSTMSLNGIGAMLGGIVEALDQESEYNKTTTNLIENGTFEELIIFTTRLSTSSSPDYVGHNGDIFVGRGTNSLYGFSHALTLKKTDLADPKTILQSFGDISVVKEKGLIMGVKFGTQFYFTTHDIVNIQIPAWKQLKRMLFTIGDSNGCDSITHLPYNEDELKEITYVSKVGYDHKFFGTNNHDPCWDSDTVHSGNGPSYRIYIPTHLRTLMELAEEPPQYDERDSCLNCFGELEFTDMVLYYNANIAMWEKHLAANEKRKADAIAGINGLSYQAGDNISFGGGATIERHESHQTSNSWNTHEVINAYMHKVEEESYSYFGVGYEMYTEEEKTTVTTIDEDGLDINITKFGFVLQESGLTDQISVDWRVNEDGVDIPAYMFYTRGGQTSCPYEGATVTQYYTPPTIISTATMKVEDPEIVVIDDLVFNVPSNKPANIAIALINNSEVEYAGWFKLYVDDRSNPDGAILKIDGAPIGNGRLFYLHSGVNQTMFKILTVEKGVAERYEDLALILCSNCEPTLADTAYFTVEFAPACTDVEITMPRENWIMNIASNDEMLVQLENYDQNYNGLEYIVIESRLVSSSQWETDQYFFFDEEVMQKPQYATIDSINKTYQTTYPIKYTWKKGYKQDGIWEIRARTYCLYSPPLEYVSPPVRGTIDTRAPQAMAVSPSNGILGPGDEISITFNENIQSALLTDSRFKISGMLNDMELGVPNTGIKFDGVHNYAQTEHLITAGGSFSIETRFNRSPHTAGTLFAYGLGTNYISLGFDEDGHVIVNVADTTYISDKTVPQNDGWKYIMLSYNRYNTTDGAVPNSFTVYLLEDNGDYHMFESPPHRLLPVGKYPASQGVLIMGNNQTHNNGLAGSAVACVHFYNVEHVAPQDIAGVWYAAKSGREPHLIGYWECGEGEGVYAEDKARNRHLMLGAPLGSADWYLYPPGYSMKTNGNFFRINSSTLPSGIYHNFTLEFCFQSDDVWTTGNAAVLNGTTIFSNEKCYLAIDLDGALNLYKKGGTLIRRLTTTKVMDGKWHHFAMSVRRNGSINIYLDNVSVATFNEQLLGDFGSGFLYFGVRWIQAVLLEPESLSHHFKGSFDEIRFWNTPLSRDMIQRNSKTKLHGTENGLLAYYPFEKWDRYEANNMIFVYTSLENIVDVENGKPEITMVDDEGGAVISEEGHGVPIKAPRMVENVRYSFVASNNKIVLNIAPDFFYQVEGVVLDINVNRVLDMSGNSCEAENWTAFVRRNPIRWDEDPIIIEMQEGETRTFTARLTNISGTVVNYVINDMPSWLTVSSGSSGTLQPMANRILTFTINSGINVGSYEEAIGATSGNNVMEYLPLQVKVTRQKPDWHVDPHDFLMSMNILGQIQIGGFPQEDVEDLLGAFIGDKCVGIASPIFVENGYLVFATIYGDSLDNDHRAPITFKLWQASTGEVFPVVRTIIPPSAIPSPVVFENALILGSYIAPVIFNALPDMKEQHIQLYSGWNMISVNVVTTPPELSILDQIQSSLIGVGVQIKSPAEGVFNTNYQGIWMGVLSSISEKRMYQVRVNANHNMTVSGLAAPFDTITIVEKWNHIGYLPSLSIPINDAFTLTPDPASGDVMKDQNAFATYIGTIGNWVGSLTHLKAGVGYSYYSLSGNIKSLQYTEYYVPGKGSEEPEKDDFNYKWKSNPNLYEGTMTMTSIVLDGKTELCSELIEIAAFCADECRGSVLLRYELALDKYVGYLMIYGTADESITLKVYDHIAQREYVPTNEPLLFANNAIIGNPLTPYPVLLPTGITGVNDVDVQSVTIHPNPVRDALYINHPWSSISHLEVTDLLGRILISKQEFSASSLNVSELTAGIYMLRVISNGEVVNLKFVKE